ncbi:TRAP transporter substrate-binding protein DctP [bacterium]|nr:TRAP transporter substrate-binding protein DctP [bacterium]
MEIVMKMSKLGITLAIVLVMVTSAVCAQTTFKLSHVRPLGTPTDIDMQKFAAEVAKGTNGRLTIKLFPASQLGNYTVVQERVGLGDIEMQLAPVGTNITKALGIVTAPYIVETFEQIPVVFDHKGKMMIAVTKLFEKEGIKVLGLYPKYFGGVALSKMPNDPKGTGNKGMKVRVPGIKSFEKTAEALGYQATPIAFSEAFTSWQTGIVDGAIGSGAEGYWGSFKDLTKVYLPTNSHLEMWFLYVSIDSFKKLSPADQKVLVDAGLAMEKARYAAAANETAEYEGLLQKNGTQVVKFTPAELKAIADTVKAKVWPQIKGDYGVELFDSVTAK